MYFGDGETIEPNQNRAILCPLNADSLQINEKILDRVAGEKITYLSIDSMEANEDDDELIQELSTEFVYSMTSSPSSTFVKFESWVYNHVIKKHDYSSWSL